MYYIFKLVNILFQFLFFPYFLLKNSVFWCKLFKSEYSFEKTSIHDCEKEKAQTKDKISKIEEFFLPFYVKAKQIVFF
jgi:hypothetical protein